jgi:hypothetical protein
MGILVVSPPAKVAIGRNMPRINKKNNVLIISMSLLEAKIPPIVANLTLRRFIRYLIWLIRCVSWAY